MNRQEIIERLEKMGIDPSKGAVRTLESLASDGVDLDPVFGILRIGAVYSLTTKECLNRLETLGTLTLY